MNSPTSHTRSLTRGLALLTLVACTVIPTVAVAKPLARDFWTTPERTVSPGRQSFANRLEDFAKRARGVVTPEAVEGPMRLSVTPKGGGMRLLVLGRF